MVVLQLCGGFLAPPEAAPTCGSGATFAATLTWPPTPSPGSYGGGRFLDPFESEQMDLPQLVADSDGPSIQSPPAALERGSPVEGGQENPAAQAPDAKGMVARGANGVASIGRHRHCVDSAGMALQPAQHLAAVQVP